MPSLLLAAAQVVVISTSMGDVKVELDAKRAPLSVKNFLEYVKSKHYDDTVFHRVIKRFMIQGGGFDAQLKQRGATNPPIKNEAGNGLKNVAGTLAMARTGVVDSATDQFFINVADNAFLDHKDDSPRGFGYAVFGKVVAGMDVVRKIENVPTATKPSADGVPLADVPVETVVVKSIRLSK
ncbi:MAG: peptidyl-prolyl cis-trans isomerase [Deltaproteobacteria bacterium]|nr:MAG: peptidyl-prolyl cis-trans isomerase [Deltaproteobacteria bacterium]